MFYRFLIIPAIYETVRILVSENSFWPQGLICCTCWTLPECAENEFSKMSAAIILDCITEAETGWDDCWLMRSQRSYLHVSYGLNTMLMSHKWLGRPCLQEYMRIIMQRLALKAQLIFRLWSPAGGEENHKNSRNAIQVILFTLLKVQALGSLNATLYFEYTTFLRYIFTPLHLSHQSYFRFDWIGSMKEDGWMGRWIILISLTTQRVRALNISSATSHQQPQATDGNHTCD